MFEKLKTVLSKYRSQIIYLIFGVLTTVVNYIVYIPCLRLSGSAWVSNAVAWAAAVIFAYVTNKPFVFESLDWSLKIVMPEFAKFVATRFASGLIETGILFLAVDTLKWNGIVWKFITSVFVVVLNYVGSKLLVFRERK